jgi:hypothetical protein
MIVNECKITYPRQAKRGHHDNRDRRDIQVMAVKNTTWHGHGHPLSCGKYTIRFQSH